MTVSNHILEVAREYFHKGNRWSGIQKQLKELYPELTDEQMEEVHDDLRYINEQRNIQIESEKIKKFPEEVYEKFKAGDRVHFKNPFAKENADMYGVVNYVSDVQLSVKVDHKYEEYHGKYMLFYPADAGHGWSVDDLEKISTPAKETEEAPVQESGGPQIFGNIEERIEALLKAKKIDKEMAERLKAGYKVNPRSVRKTLRQYEAGGREAASYAEPPEGVGEAETTAPGDLQISEVFEEGKSPVGEDAEDARDFTRNRDKVPQDPDAGADEGSAPAPRSEINDRYTQAPRESSKASISIMDYYDLIYPMEIYRDAEEFIGACFQRWGSKNLSERDLSLLADSAEEAYNNSRVANKIFEAYYSDDINGIKKALKENTQDLINAAHASYLTGEVNRQTYYNFKDAFVTAFSTDKGEDWLNAALLFKALINEARQKQQEKVDSGEIEPIAPKMGRVAEYPFAVEQIARFLARQGLPYREDLRKVRGLDKVERYKKVFQEAGINPEKWREYDILVTVQRALNSFSQ